MQFGLVGFHLEKITKMLSYFLKIIRINKYFMIAFDDLWCFNATFNIISAISWRPVLVVDIRREPSTMGKQLVNFITCANPRRIGDRLV